MRTLFLLSTLSALAACSVQSEYDPDWDPEGPVGGGKADGVIDVLPRLELGDTVSGSISGDNAELFVMQLQRADVVVLSMTVDRGDLEPHLSFFRGTHAYVTSDSWDVEGETLHKIYTAEHPGIYVVAARAYRGQGSGDYTLGARCLGGPCIGQAPPPLDPMSPSDVADCIEAARICSFAEMPRYGGAIGEVRAEQIFGRCLEAATFAGGSSCASACDWTGQWLDDDEDDAGPLCNAIRRALIFYADQPTQCTQLLDGCVSSCYGEATGDDNASGMYETVEGACFLTGYNGNCDSFARNHESCGGQILTSGGRECTELCRATVGATIEDLDTLCSSDIACEDRCDVEVTAAEEVCGPVEDDNGTCFVRWMRDEDAYMCEDALLDIQN